MWCSVFTAFLLRQKHHGDQYVCKPRQGLNLRFEFRLITHDSLSLVTILKFIDESEHCGLKIWIDPPHGGNISHSRASIYKSGRGIPTMLDNYLCRSEIIISNLLQRPSFFLFLTEIMSSDQSLQISPLDLSLSLAASTQVSPIFLCPSPPLTMLLSLTSLHHCSHLSVLLPLCFTALPSLHPSRSMCPDSSVIRWR